MTIRQKVGGAFTKIGAALSGGISDMANPALWVQNAIVGSGKTASGVSVTPETAMGLSAYYACIRNVSEDIAGLPFKVFKRLEPRGKEPAPEHPVYQIIHDTPSEELAAMTLWEVLLHWALGWGNGYAEILKSGGNVVQTLSPIHPSRVLVGTDRKTGQLFYEVHNDDGTRTNLLPDQMFHLRGLGDQIAGYSVARVGSESFGRAMATQEFSSSFFGNGSTFSGVYKHPGKLDLDARKRLKETWPRGLPSAHNPLFLEGGMEWQQLGVNPDEAQMLQTMQFSVEDVARWFRMPLHKIQSMESATFSNIEHQAREYVGDTLLPWIRRIESEVRRKLFRPGDRETFTAEFVIRGLLRGDVAAQSAFYSTMTTMGAMSVNEVRELEGMNPVEGGDEFRVQLNMGSMAEGGDQDDDDDQGDSPQDRNADRKRQVRGLKKAHARVFADAAERLATKESRALQTAAKRFEGDDTAFSDWSFTFYGKHKTHAVEAMRHPSMALGEVICIACGMEALTVSVADAIDEALSAGDTRGAKSLSEVPARIEGLKGAPALAAEKMPDRIEAVVYKTIGIEQ